MSGEYLHCGKVTVPANQVKSRTVSMDKDGRSKYVIEFNNGTIAAFYSNKEGTLSSKTVSCDGGEQNVTDCFGIMGLELRSSSDRPNIDCKIAEIDVSGGSSDTVNVKKSDSAIGSYKVFSEYNFGFVKHNDNDKVEIDKDSPFINAYLK